MTSPIGSFLRVTISKGSIGARKGLRPHLGLEEGALKQRLRELGGAAGCAPQAPAGAAARPHPHRPLQRPRKTAAAKWSAQSSVRCSALIQRPAFPRTRSLCGCSGSEFNQEPPPRRTGDSLRGFAGADHAWNAPHTQRTPDPRPGPRLRPRPQSQKAQRPDHRHPGHPPRPWPLDVATQLRPQGGWFSCSSSARRAARRVPCGGKPRRDTAFVCGVTPERVKPPFRSSIAVSPGQTGGLSPHPCYISPAAEPSPLSNHSRTVASPSA